ncbi:uncharacterized protein PV09_04786 [Verruconis gallopava]|uniref:Uncharacterized protein n=1 Tax=Verruconis gallopava TaxID=253628 RepID=A0A0D2AXR7_9PEZI|nr:uncharacterized protein PV09_04786 [Verruconis gallopava]KIW03949.1 hypothetical protein PV09_04786 [Verruconis gallopava]
MSPWGVLRGVIFSFEPPFQRPGRPIAATHAQTPCPCGGFKLSHCPQSLALCYQPWSAPKIKSRTAWPDDGYSVCTDWFDGTKRPPLAGSPGAPRSADQTVWPRKLAEAVLPPRRFDNRLFCHVVETQIWCCTSRSNHPQPGNYRKASHCSSPALRAEHLSSSRERFGTLLITSFSRTALFICRGPGFVRNYVQVACTPGCILHVPSNAPPKEYPCLLPLHTDG